MLPDVLPDAAIDLGGGVVLALRDSGTVDEMLRLTERNLDRLREWEGWAHGDQTRAGMVEYTEWNLAAWRGGTVAPMVIRVGGVPVGSISLRLEEDRRVAEIGWWIDGEWEGRGLVTRAAEALVELARRSDRIDVVQARIGLGNVRSRRVAERLGMSVERTLPGALQVGAVRHDAALYVLDVATAHQGDSSEEFDMSDISDV
ncbi:GNAT family N-acetyltransferase [Agromyces sp. MMS24-JH15]|uniref:GNAT family N-acetyltransferase n=1 Tax=Agromyces sp. MMS24-JH15 TaxID=3243765 RepID=UPI003749273A